MADYFAGEARLAGSRRIFADAPRRLESKKNLRAFRRFFHAGNFAFSLNAAVLPARIFSKFCQ